MDCSTYYPREFPKINSIAFELGQIEREEALEEHRLELESLRANRLPGSAAVEMTAQPILTQKKDNSYRQALRDNLFPDANDRVMRYGKENKTPVDSIFSSEVTLPPENLSRTKILSVKPSHAFSAPGISKNYYDHIADLYKHSLAFLLKNDVYVTNIEDKPKNIEDKPKKIRPPNGPVLLSEGPLLPTTVAWHCPSKLLIGLENEVKEALLRQYDTESGQASCSKIGFDPLSILRSVDKNLVIAGGENNLLGLDLRQKEIAFSTELEEKICSIATTEGNIFATGDNENIVNLWDRRSMDMNTPLPITSYSHEAGVKGLAFNSQDSNILASGGGTADRKIKIFDVSQDKILHEHLAGSQVCGLSWHKDGSHLYANFGYLSNAIQTYVYAKGRFSLVQTISKAHSQRILFSANSRPVEDFYVTASTDQAIKIWDVTNNTKKNRLGRLSLPNIR